MGVGGESSSFSLTHTHSCARARSLSSRSETDRVCVCVFRTRALTHSHLSLSRSLARRQNGKTPLAIAQERHNNESAKLLMEAMGSAPPETPQRGIEETHLENQIREFYLKHAPDRVSKAGETARRYVNEQDVLNEALMSKYGCNLRENRVQKPGVARAAARQQQGDGTPDLSGVLPCCAVLLFLLAALACAFAFPIMYIVFSQVFAWGEMERTDESGETKELTCHDMYPKMMQISGYFQIAFVVEELITGVLLTRKPEESLKKKIWAIKGCFAMALLVMNSMMWYYLFESNKECGEQLWNFGCTTFVLFLLQFCQAGGQARRE